jgi:hypothetical protein
MGGHELSDYQNKVLTVSSMSEKKQKRTITSHLLSHKTHKKKITAY